MDTDGNKTLGARRGGQEECRNEVGRNRHDPQTKGKREDGGGCPEDGMYKTR